MPEFKVKHTLSFEAYIEAPTEELVPSIFTNLMYDPIEPTEHWDITQHTYGDE